MGSYKSSNRANRGAVITARVRHILLTLDSKPKLIFNMTIRYCHYNATNVQAPYLQKSQTSVIRSNCMDCLDRTNVVQSTIAKWVLTKQLQELRILSSSEKVDEHESFMHLYRQGKRWK
jgi:hypothetical protein